MNIEFLSSFNSGAPLQLDLNGSNKNDIAWDVAPVDEDGNGTDDWLVVVGSTVVQTTDQKDVFALQVFLDGSTGWYYHDDFQSKDDEAQAVYVTSDDHIILCGTSRTKFVHPTHDHFSDDVWVQKLDFDGDPDITWSANGNGRFYGSYATSVSATNPDKGNDIAEDADGKYVVVAQGYAENGDITDDVQGNGDYWILQLDPDDGSLLQSRIWFNSAYSKNDYATSVAVDCNSGHYIVSGFCGSCDPDTTTDVALLDVDPADLSVDVVQQYGLSNKDHNAYDVIQSFDETFGTCDEDDGFVSLGVAHHCFSNSHNFYGIKTGNDLTSSTFMVNCTGAEGIVRGGSLEDNGYNAVQALDGYLLAGVTFSNALDSDPNGEVSCNHYSCGNPASDFWLAHVNACTGELDWEESIGTAGNDACYSIRRLNDDSYIMAGYSSFSASDQDLYIVLLSIVQCNEPEDLQSGNTGCTLDFEWDGDKCNSYHLQYKRNALPWGNDMYPTESEAHPVATAAGTYSWRVKTNCSPDLSTGRIYG